LQLSAATFFQEVIRNRLSPVGMVEGTDFRFGHDREGNVETLGRFCAEADMLLHVVPPLHIDGVPVSSSRIRQALALGNIPTASRWLGRPYRLAGIVGTGQRRGKQLGFPTANLTQIATLVPAEGVYAVRAWHEGNPWPAAANIGPNPTFGEQTPKVEVHLIGFDGDLYDQELSIDFLAKLRDTRRFESVEQLLAQIRSDITTAMTIANSTDGAALSP
jgi:riboflavin kinase/FMN adenylyltransferase